MVTRPVAAMTESVARQLVREHAGDSAAIAAALADEVLDRGRRAPNTCRPLLRAYEIARNQQVPTCDRCGQQVEPHDFGPTIDGSPMVRWASLGDQKFCPPGVSYHRVNGSAYVPNQQVPGGGE